LTTWRGWRHFQLMRWSMHQ